jgi:hypothetical protein
MGKQTDSPAQDPPLKSKMVRICKKINRSEQHIHNRVNHHMTMKCALHRRSRRRTAIKDLVFHGHNFNTLRPYEGEREFIGEFLFIASRYSVLTIGPFKTGFFQSRCDILQHLCARSSVG